MVKRLKYLFFLTMLLPGISIAASIRNSQVYSNNTDLKFEKISVEKGLSQSTVYAILQDSKGFMWFGTRTGGLNRYDGYGFKVYLNHPSDTNSISDNEVISLLEDHEGCIWIGTRNGGLNKLNPETETFSRFYLPDGNSRSISYEVNDLYFSNEKVLWIGTNKGLFYFDRETGKLIPELPSSETGNISRLAPYRDNMLLISSRERLSLYDIESKNLLSHEFKDIFINRTSEDKQVPVLTDYMNNIWVGSVEGIIVLGINNDNEIIRYHPFDELTFPLNTDIRTIAEDRNRNIWFGTYNGLAKYDPEKNTTELFRHDENRPSSISHNSIRSFLEDRDGNFWIGTWGGGVNLNSEWISKFDHFKHVINDPKSLSDNVVSSFAEDGQGIWIGTEQGGLNFYDTVSSEFAYWINDPADPASLSSSHIKSLLLDSEKNLWIGTFGNGGLNRFNRSTKTFTRYFEGLNIFSLEETADGSIWLGTMEGLIQMNKKAEVISIFNQQEEDQGKSISSDFVINLFVDSDDNLWIGTKGGGLNLYIPDQKIIKKFQFQDSKIHLFNKVSVFSFAEDLEGNIWIGTSQGLSKYDPLKDSIKCCMFSDALNDYVINGLVTDHLNNLWIATNGGLSCLNTDGGKIKNYVYSDGLQSNEFNRGAYFKTESGKILLGGINGFNSFYPGDINHNPNPPILQITGFRVFHNTTDVREEIIYQAIKDDGVTKITLSPKQTAFTIEFVALNYILPEKNEYKYLLEGFDKSWINAGNRRSAHYMNMNPGKYTFRLIASNNDNVWSENEKTIEIEILPPFWKTIYASILLVVLILILMIFLRRIQISRIKQQNLLEFERMEHKRIEEHNQMKLRFFTDISHELKNPLTLIISPLEILQKSIPPAEKYNYLISTISKNVKRLLTLIDQLMYFRKIENQHVKLAVKRGDIKAFIESVIANFEDHAKNKKITIEFLPAPQVFEESWFDPGFLDKIISNILSNAIKFTNSGGKVKIILASGKGKNVMEIVDSGNGIPQQDLDRIFDRFYSNNQTDPNNKFGTGLGLAITKSLVELHHGTITVESKENIGSKFTITLPDTYESYKREELSGEEIYRNEQTSVQMSGKLITDEFIKNLSLSDTKDKIILIVEDNLELSSYLATYLDKYDVRQAANGKEGLEKAIQLLPDIIISDVMMPEMNGLDLCRNVKNNYITSHIPVILLTAKADIETKITGLETGADAYMEKPFNMEHLEAQVKNLLRQRNIMKQVYAQQISMDTESSKVSPYQHKFLQKAAIIISGNIDDTEFGVDQLCESLNLSRSQLFRKFKVICDSTPGEFIRAERLNYAVALMRSEDITINEICYRSGFTNPSYFITIFKKHFGKTPKEYASEIIKK